MPIPLTDATLPAALADLTTRDPRLARIVADYGPPPLWAREPGFPTLLRIILEQQVSLASAQAAFERLLALASTSTPAPATTPASSLTPERFLELDDATLKAAGFSRQKTRYGRELAGALRSGSLDLAALDALDDDAVRAALTKLVGIGRWTADIYLLMALCRPDAWPAGDLALATAARHALGLAATPRTAELEAIGAAWRPWRAVAARVLWHFYLSGGTRKK
ncbi:MAG: DNA-3-methyladenine glycosylase 2 family protein [Anaerolineae bacterium]|nr:DNA-3-methyladenine glycosylase 2 family protein [Anaerolineae bacterium]